MSDNLSSQNGPGRPKDLAKREAILEAAKRLFLSNGYASTSMDAVAAEAGVSKLTVYSHFNDKETLFSAAVMAKCEEQLPTLFFELPDGMSVENVLLNIARGFHQLINSDESVNLHRLIMALGSQDPKLSQIFFEAGPERMLQGMERFAGIFVCTTNLMDRIDQAALRRFTFKIQFKPLRADQRERMFVVEALGGRQADLTGAQQDRLARLNVLCPGDFAAVKRQADILANPDGGPVRQRHLDPAIRIMPLRRSPGRITDCRRGEHGFAHHTYRQERWRRIWTQCATSRLTAPVPQQTAADIVALGNFREAGTRHFRLRDNPQLLFRSPTPATLDTGDDLHADQRPLIFAALLRAPLESGALRQGRKAVAAGWILPVSNHSRFNGFKPPAVTDSNDS